MGPYAANGLIASRKENKECIHGSIIDRPSKLQQKGAPVRTINVECPEVRNHGQATIGAGPLIEISFASDNITAPDFDDKIHAMDSFDYAVGSLTKLLSCLKQKGDSPADFSLEKARTLAVRYLTENLFCVQHAAGARSDPMSKDRG